MLRRLLVVLVLAPAAACGSTVPDPGGPVTQEDLEALPAVEEAAAGEFEASDGETTQTVAVVALDPDADEDAMRTAVEVVSASDADFWAVYLDSSGIDPEYPDDDEASGFSSADVVDMPDPADAVPVVLGARETARTAYAEARARVAWSDGELATTVLLPGGGVDETTAVATALATADAGAPGPVSVDASGRDPFPGSPVSELVTATSLSSDTGIDDDVLSRWADLAAAADPAGDEVAPFQVLLDVADGTTSVNVRWHLAAQGARGRRPVYDPQGDPADVTPQVWGTRLEPAIDGVVDVAADGTTERWSVSVSELSDPLASLVELEDDSPRPGPDELGRTWSRDAWDRWQAGGAGSPEAG